MLQSTLSNAEKTVRSLKIINDDKLLNLIKLLSLYEKDTFIHPGSVMNKINIDAPAAYKILKELVMSKILQINFQYYCFNCRSFSGNAYYDLNCVPLECLCEHCDMTLSNDNKNVIAIYRVIN